MRKGIICSLLVMALVFITFMEQSVLVSATGTDAVKYVDTFSMSDYWNADEDKAKSPMMDGYIFAGWYDFNKNPIEKASIDAGNIPAKALAKFVSDDILCVKTQAEAGIEKPSTDMTSETKTTFRLLSAVDSTNYQEVGFEYQLGDNSVKTKKMTKIWTGLKQKPGDTSMIQAADVFGTGAYAFIALDIINVSQSNFDKTVYVRPYWVTMDGTKVMGLAKNARIEDKHTDYNYVSIPVNLLTDGAAPVEVAAGRITVTYDTTKFHVAKKVQGNKTQYLIDTGRVLPEMNYRVDEVAGTITFVANGTVVDEDIVSDGLFANIRFQRKEGYTSENATEADIAKTVNQFCDWDEEDKTAGINVR